MTRLIVRLRDIAEKTGFSTNTVSLALRRSPRIPERTREIIERTARELNYLPNHVAKSLVSRETKTVGLVVPDINNPVLTQAAHALGKALAARGYGTLLATSNNTVAEEIRTIDMLRSRQVDGMLIYPTNHETLEHIRLLRRANYPVVLLVGDPRSGVDTVAVDDARGAYKATRHLIAEGHTRIGILDDASGGNSEKRDGYSLALREAGIEPDPRLYVDPQGASAANGLAAMDALMRAGGRPTAVFATTDALGIGVLRWCDAHGVSVPDDLAIVGFDNTEYGEHASVPLSTVDYAVDQVTRLAVDRLMSLIAAEEGLPDPEASLIDPELVVRDSSGRGRRIREEVLVRGRAAE